MVVPLEYIPGTAEYRHQHEPPHVIGVVVCQPNYPNRPDLEICIAGPEHRIILKLPFPPCKVPGEGNGKCVEWSVKP